MALLGVLARVHVPDRERVEQRVAEIEGVSSFSVDQAERIGLLIECESVDEAHAVLKEHVERVPGILGAWPVFSHFE